MSGDKSFATVPGFVGDKLYSFHGSGAEKELIPGDGATEDPSDSGMPLPGDLVKVVNPKLPPEEPSGHGGTA